MISLTVCISITHTHSFSFILCLISLSIPYKLEKKSLSLTVSHTFSLSFPSASLPLSLSLALCCLSVARTLCAINRIDRRTHDIFLLAKEKIKEEGVEAFLCLSTFLYFSDRLSLSPLSLSFHISK